MAVRPWVPGDLGAAVTLWVDTLDPATYVMNADGVTVNSWSSKVGSIVLNAGSGRPRKTALNGGTAFLGGSNFAYFIANATGVFPSETSDATIMFVGYGTGSYNPSMRLSNSGSFVRGIGTVDTAKAGLPKSGNDLASAVAYAATGNIVIGEWIAGTSARATIWVDGTQANTRTIANTSVVVNRLEILNNGNNASNVDAVRATVIVNRTLTLDERQRLEGWAAWSLGYVDRLPANHGYKTAAPTVDDGATTSITGTSASSLSGLGVASAARLAIVGAASLALAGIGSTSTSSAPVTAQAQASLAGIVSAGAGAVSAAGAGAVALQTISASAAGSLPVLAVSTTPLGDVTNSATGSLPVASVASSTLGPVGTASAARADVRGTASTALDSITGSATAGGQSLATASSASVLGSISTAATGLVPVVGTGSTTLAPIASNSGAASAVRGAGSASLGAIVSASAGSIPIGASGAANLSGVRADGRGGAVASAIASSALGGIVGTASATVGQDTDGQLVGPGWTLFATPRRFVASAIRRSFIVSSTGCKRMLNFPPKYAHEVRNAVVDFAPALSDGEGLIGQPTVAVMKGDLAVSAARIEGTAVHFTLSGGTAATKVVQSVEVHCQTDGDQVLEEVVSVTMLS